MGFDRQESEKSSNYFVLASASIVVVSITMQAKFVFRMISALNSDYTGPCLYIRCQKDFLALGGVFFFSNIFILH